MYYVARAKQKTRVDVWYVTRLIHIFNGEGEEREQISASRAEPKLRYSYPDILRELDATS